jgi:hypothetical protein
MLELAEFLAGAYADEDDARRFRKLFPEWCTERQKQYGKYKRMLPDLDDSPSETLFWEFERKLAGSLGLPEDPSVMSVIDQSVMSLIEVLNLGELITGQATPVEYVTNQSRKLT